MRKSKFLVYNKTMINFDSLSLKAWVLENADYLTNASVRKIQQPSRRELVLHLRNNGENKKLYININPEFFHVCLAEDLQRRGISIPDAAPMFCMLLRKYIQNGRIAEVRQPFGERILEFRFEYKDALDEINTLCLAVELMGKYSNVILYNVKTGIIIGCAHNVGEEKSKIRELAGTLPYVYPVPQDKTDICGENFEDFKEKFNGNFDKNSVACEIANDYAYMTVSLVKQAFSALEIEKFDENNLKKLFETLKNTSSLSDFEPAISEDFSQFSLVKNSGFNPVNSVNQMINDYFEFNQIQKILKQKKLRLYAHIDTQIKKLKKQIEIFKLKLLDCEKADNYRVKGDILMMNVNENVAPILKLQNPYDGEFVEIELDERYSIVQNANRYYKLYKKTKTAVDYASSQLEELENQLNLLEEQRFFVEIASNLEEIEEISLEIGLKTEQSGKKEKKKQINLEMHEIGGFKVYLGKNSVQNDFLLSKVASPEDLWFHPLNMHGSHVILKKNNSKEEIPNEVLLSCAKLAKRFSKANQDAKIPIIYTERKYVKKANSKIAFVTYKNEIEIYC